MLAHRSAICKLLLLIQTDHIRVNIFPQWLLHSTLEAFTYSVWHSSSSLSFPLLLPSQILPQTQHLHQHQAGALMAAGEEKNTGVGAEEEVVVAAAVAAIQAEEVVEEATVTTTATMPPSNFLRTFISSSA